MRRRGHGWIIVTHLAWHWHSLWCLRADYLSHYADSQVKWLKLDPAEMSNVRRSLSASVIENKALSDNVWSTQLLSVPLWLWHFFGEIQRLSVLSYGWGQDLVVSCVSVLGQQLLSGQPIRGWDLADWPIRRRVECERGQGRVELGHWLGLRAVRPQCQSADGSRAVKTWRMTLTVTLVTAAWTPENVVLNVKC